MRNKFIGYLKRFTAAILAAVMILSSGDFTALATTGTPTTYHTYAVTFNSSKFTGEPMLVGIHYKNANGVEKTAYADLQSDTLKKSASNTIPVTTDSESSKMQKLYTKYTGYAFSSWDTSADEAEVQSPKSKQTVFLKMEDEIKTITSIDFTAGVNSPETFNWGFRSLQVIDVTKINGMNMDGYVSGNMQLDYEGTVLATVEPSSGASYVLISGSADSVYTATTTGEETLKLTIPEEAQASQKSVKTDVFFKINITDTYGAGVETYRNENHLYSLSNLRPEESLIAEIHYKTTKGNTKTMLIPVMSSAICYASSKLNDSSASVADFAGQGESIVFKASLYDYKCMDTTSSGGIDLYYGSNAIDNSGIDLVSKSEHHASAADTDFTIDGVVVYDGLTDSDVSFSVADNLLVPTINNVSDKTVYVYKAGTVNGKTLSTSGSTKITLKQQTGADNTTGVNTNKNKKYLICFQTEDAQKAATTSDIKFSLSYVTSQNATKSKTSDTYKLEDKVKEFYGYWPDTNGNDCGYLMKMTKGSKVYALVELSDVYQFTALNITLEGTDDWQMSGFAIYDVTNKSGILPDRTASWVDKTAGSGSTLVASKVQYDRDITANYLCSLFTMADFGTLTNNGTGESMKLYIKPESGKKKVTYDFTSKDVEEVEQENWRTENYSTMSYSIATSGLDFVNKSIAYTVTVQVGSGEEDDVTNGNYGSENLFYFQLVFKNGTSAIVQANQQLQDDYFLEGKPETFEIICNQDLGDLKSINIIPDSSSSQSNIYDKLNIESIEVTKNGSTNQHLCWQFDCGTEGIWVGIDYQDDNGNSSSIINKPRDESEYITTLDVTGTTVKETLLFTLETGELKSLNNNLAFQGTMTMDIHYVDTDGVAQTLSDIDVVKLIHEYQDLDATKQDNNLYCSGEDMFKVGTCRYFTYDVTDMKYITQVDFYLSGPSTMSGDIRYTWTMEHLKISKIVKDKGKVISAIDDEYIFNGTTSDVADNDSDETYVLNDIWNTMNNGKASSVMQVPLTGPNGQDVVICDPTSSAYNVEYTVNRTPENGDDEVNITIVMPDSCSSYLDKMSMEAVVVYKDESGNSYKSTASNMNKGTITTSDGKTKNVFYCKNLGVKYMQIVSLMQLTATGTTQDAKPEAIYMQRIRDGVVVDDYTFACNGQNAVNVAWFTERNATDQYPDYEVVNLNFGKNTSTSILSAESSDVGVSIQYVSQNDPTNTVYSSETIFLTDQNIESIKKYGLASIKFSEPNVKKITGVTVYATGKRNTVDVDYITAGVYKYSQDAAGNTNGISALTDNYKVAHWFSFDGTDEGNIINGSRKFTSPESDRSSADNIVPVKILVKTKTALTDTSSAIPMEVTYETYDSDIETMTISSIKPYLTNAASELSSGSTAEINLAIKGMKRVVRVTLTSPESSAWAIESLQVCYGDGVSISDELADFSGTESGKIISTDGTDINLSVITVQTRATVGSLTFEASSAEDDKKTVSVVIDDAGNNSEITIPVAIRLNGTGYTEGYSWDIKSPQSTDSSVNMTAIGTAQDDSNMTITIPSNNSSTARTYEVKISSTFNPECYVTYTITVNPVSASLNSSNTDSGSSDEDSGQTVTKKGA